MTKSICVKNVLVSIISSIDTFNYLLKDHHRRTAIIAYQLGNLYGLEKAQMDDLILAASLHDIGALHISERDQLIQIDVHDPKKHEMKGAQMLSGFKPFNRISEIVRHHHIHYDSILNGTVAAEDVPLECYLLHLADRIDVMLLHFGEDHEAVIREISGRFGSVFAPFLRGVFMEATGSHEFWANINVVSYQELLLRSLDEEHYAIDSETLESIAKIFARIIDHRSPWTTRHSETVSRLAFRIGELLGFTQDMCWELKIAGYLHDIGKIAVPVELINSKNKLSPTEFEQIKNHVIYSTMILSPISEFDAIISLVSCHHEKRDRSGYPMKPQEKLFSLQIDALAFADIFSALSENRPYRKGLSREMMIETLAEFVPQKLSPRVYEVIMEHFDELLAIACGFSGHKPLV